MCMTVKQEIKNTAKTLEHLSREIERYKQRNNWDKVKELTNQHDTLDARYRKLIDQRRDDLLRDQAKGRLQRASQSQTIVVHEMK